MANLLDEITGTVNEAGRDVNVIDRQLPVKIGLGSILFEIALWVTIPILVLTWLFPYEQFGIFFREFHIGNTSLSVLNLIALLIFSSLIFSKFSI